MKDISNESKMSLALSKRDQIIESFKEHKQQLEIIDRSGPKDKDDIKMVQMCIKFVIVEVYLSEAEQMKIKEDL